MSGDGWVVDGKRVASWWGSSFTVCDDDGLPVKGGGIIADDGTVLAGEAPPETPE